MYAHTSIYLGSMNVQSLTVTAIYEKNVFFFSQTNVYIIIAPNISIMAENAKTKVIPFMGGYIKLCPSYSFKSKTTGEDVTLDACIKVGDSQNENKISPACVRAVAEALRSNQDFKAFILALEKEQEGGKA